MKLEHVALNVPDPAAAADWYVEHLGLRVVRAGDPPQDIRFLSDGRGGVLEMYANPAAGDFDASALSPYAVHLAFAAEDISVEHARLIEAGAETIGGIDTTPDGDLLAFLRDPWGVTLQLVQRAEPLER